MRLYYELFKRALQKQFTYRAVIFAGFLTNLFFGVLRASVMKALYAGQAEVAGISIEGAITFTGLSQATIGFLSMFSWFAIIQQVYSGEVASDLLKPMSYYGFWMAQDFGRAVVDLTLRGMPIILVYAIFFGITLPASLGQWLALALALLMAWMIGFSWRFVTNMSAFWTPNAVGIARFAFLLMWFFSGFMFPLRFLPDWFVKICYLTPFPQMLNTITEIYLGVLDGPGIARALAGQFFWCIVLFLAGQAVYRAGVRRLVIQGG